MGKIRQIIKTEIEMFHNACKEGKWATFDYFFLYAAGVVLGILIAILI